MSGPVRLHPAPQAQAIKLFHGRPAIEVAPEHVYFAFASGRLSYDCVSCNAQCCRGHGYLVTIGPELDRQLAVRPELRFFLAPQNDTARNQHRVRNCPPSCFFLNDRGLCSLHAEHGYEAKPETCRLFPFNHLRRAGDYLIVAPHDSLCPIQVEPPGEASDRSTYGELLHTMSLPGIYAEVPVCNGLLSDLDILISLERQVVDLSEQYMDQSHYAGFAAAQLDATYQTLRNLLPVNGPCPQPPADGVIERFLEQVCELLGFSRALAKRADALLTRTVTAVTPALRSQLVFRDAVQDRKAAPALWDGLELDRVPYLLAALHALANLAELAGMRAVTYQTVFRLFHDYRSLLFLLAHVDCVVAWRPGVLIDLRLPNDEQFQQPFIRLARALLPERNRKARIKLGDLVSEVNRFDGVERLRFLQLLAQRVEGRLVSLERVGLEDRWARPNFRSSFQRWVINHLSEEVLGAALDVARRHRDSKSRAAQ